MTVPEGRILSIDLGAVRCGLALSDPLGITAQPLGHFPRGGARRDLDEVSNRVREHAVHTVVVGLPRLMSGEEGEQAAAARKFAARLRGRLGPGGVRIELWDERLTSVEAERTLIAGNVRRNKRKQVVDSMAAMLILQGFLEARSDRGADPA